MMKDDDAEHLERRQWYEAWNSHAAVNINVEGFVSGRDMCGRDSSILQRVHAKRVRAKEISRERAVEVEFVGEMVA